MKDRRLNFEGFILMCSPHDLGSGAAKLLKSEKYDYRLSHDALALRNMDLKNFEEHYSINCFKQKRASSGYGQGVVPLKNT